MMHLIDSHCHLDFEQFDIDRDSVLSHCEILGVQTIVVPGVTAEHWNRLLEICEQSPLLLPALGLHPMFMAQHRPEHLKQLSELIKKHNIVAIGEIGLDFYLPDYDKDAQIHLFTEQLKIAQHAQLPVLLHVRKAHDQTISLLREYPVRGGIVHAFSGSRQQAEQYRKLGFLFGVGGAITHSRATRLRTLMSELPLSCLVLETDSPDMALSGMQGQRNTPENIPLILESLAQIRTESREDIAQATTHNCQRILRL